MQWAIKKIETGTVGVDIGNTLRVTAHATAIMTTVPEGGRGPWSEETLHVSRHAEVVLQPGGDVHVSQVVADVVRDARAAAQAAATGFLQAHAYPAEPEVTLRADAPKVLKAADLIEQGKAATGAVRFEGSGRHA